ncbi:ketosamine-3-kinase isoform X1 [Gadus chalcogrammus]|uniref:ketosamine-3-kinase-like isoform X2 n=1 Tax=Gadus chalcogrammus TaxID=1042646 RepID=UPI0024C294D9|nr:ketosamine-3-kinase-like isoform X2 [Gadus chalcogrammus]XP_056432781.1 ketosamine-3-kinase isoform X1 [Gadus chalcogrammus]
MEAMLKKELGTSMLKYTGYSGGGCISEGQSYDTDNGRVFVKINHKSQVLNFVFVCITCTNAITIKAKRMFDGEMASLDAILQTETIKVPKPVKVIELDTGGSAFVMEHLDMKGLTKYSTQLGEKLANLHLHNKRSLDKQMREQQTVGKGAGLSEMPLVEKYGFHVATCCGYLPQENEWQDDWVTFYSRHRLQHQLNMVEKSCGDREARELWSHLQLKIPQLFTEVEVVPALLHGDLWGGNVAQTTEGPVIFDPASFYGHSEYELGVMAMFGGFSSSFYAAYHENVPEAPGFTQRNQLYQLFHNLNHWNHFGGGYKGSSLRIMKDLVK